MRRAVAQEFTNVDRIMKKRHGYTDVIVTDQHGLIDEIVEPIGRDPAASTRLAVLRAAAAIGEEMP